MSPRAKRTAAKAASAPKPRTARPTATVAGAGAPPAPSPSDLAPVVVPVDDETDAGAVPAEVIAAPESPALVFPTDAHWAAIRADVIDANPALAAASERRIVAAMQEHAPAFAARLHTRADRGRTLVQLVAPVFPTDEHVIALNRAIPALTADEQAGVLQAGHAAFVASIAAGEPITEVPAA